MSIIKSSKAFSLFTVVVLLFSLSIRAFATSSDTGVLTNKTLIYVSYSGSDENGNGSILNPYKTIAKAQTVAKLKSALKKDVVIYLREGTYSPINLIEENSGSEDCTITYSAYDNENVCIKNYSELLANDFIKVTDSNVLDKIPLSAQGDIYSYNLSSLENYDGLLKTIRYGTSSSIGSLLYVDDEQMTISRYPNTEGNYLEINSIGNVVSSDQSGSTVSLDDSERIINWYGSQNAFIGGYFANDYSYETAQITSIDPVSSSINAKFTSNILNQNSRVYFFNLLSELDCPGEWYVDTNTKTLYFYPPYDMSQSKIYITSGESDLLTARNIRYVNFENITFEGTSSNGIILNNCENVNLKGCTVKNIGINGINITECKNCSVTDSLIFNIGCIGISVLQYSEKQTLNHCNVLIDNNHIYNFSKTVRTYQPAIYVAGVGNTVSHNKIHDGPHNALMIGLNDNIIEYNEIYDVLKETNDAGAIYLGRSWTDLGNIIRYNKIYRCSNSIGFSTVGIYLDDMMSGVTVFGNIIDDVSQGIIIGGGHFNTVKNNIIGNANNSTNYMMYSISADSRGTEKWFQSAFEANDDESLLQKCTYIKTIIEKHAITDPLWREKYPFISNILKNDYRIPKENVIENNIIYKHSNTSINENILNYGTVSNNVVFNENPGFANPENMDYSFTDVIIENFQSIPFDEIGLR